MSTTITCDTTIHRNEGMVQAKIDGETVMMSIENGGYYGLDAIASRIWEIIETPLSVKSICDQLSNEYDVSESQCQCDVVKFLNDMVENNVIELTA